MCACHAFPVSMTVRSRSGPSRISCHELNLSQIVLLPYNGAAGAKYEWLGHEYSLADRVTQSDDTMNELADICRRDGLNVQIGG